MGTVIWVSGASSGIGAAFVDEVPDPGARVIGISRRANPAIDNIPADLSDPASWGDVEASFREVLGDASIDRAIFLHCAGTVVGDGPVIAAGVDAYREAVLLNSCAGQVLGRAFLSAVLAAEVSSTLVLCSSPGASLVLPGLSHYCAGKAAIEMWARIVAAELGDDPDAPRVFAAIPWAVDTELLRDVMNEDEADLPLSAVFREAAGKDELSSPQQAAAEIWAGIEQGVPQGGRWHVGQVPEEPDVLLEAGGPS